jgi:nicotinamidase-related amidase
MLKTLCLIGLLLSPVTGARAQALPAAMQVKVDPVHTALLVLDMAGTRDAARGPCNPSTKPRCIATIPHVAGLLAAARAHRLFVLFSVTSKGGVADIAPALAPRPGEPVVQAGPDKFVGTDLAQQLAMHHITRVIVTGTAAEGAVLDTAIEAILRDKIDVVLPLDGISSTGVYEERYVAYDLTHAPGLAGHTVLTSCAAISFRAGAP